MITRKKVLSAFDEYNEMHPNNDYKPMGKTVWFKHKNYSWTIHDKNGKPYPLKFIYSLIVKKEPRKFNTFNAKSELEKLGFRIIELTTEMRNSL